MLQQLLDTKHRMNNDDDECDDDDDDDDNDDDDAVICDTRHSCSNTVYTGSCCHSCWTQSIPWIMMMRIVMVVMMMMPMMMMITMMMMQSSVTPGIPAVTLCAPGLVATAVGHKA